MSETIMKLNNDGRIVQIDNVSWSYYIDVDRARSLEDHKSGKWMHFFNDISFAAAICRKAVLEGTVEQVISDAVNSILDNPEGIPLVMARQIFNVFEKESLWSFLG